MVELVGGRVRNIETGLDIAATSTPISLRACQHAPVDDEPFSIIIPARSLVSHAPQVVSTYRININHADDPVWRRLPMEPKMFAQGGVGLGDGRPMAPDRPIGPRAQPGDPIAVAYSRDGWRVMGVDPNPGSWQLGAAIDIGTTTVVVQLVDLASGEVLTQAGAFNQQIRLGEDVLTRINMCLVDPNGVSQLQEAVVAETITPLLIDALDSIHASVHDLRTYMIAGNTTMLHLLTGTNPGSMGMAPFTPKFLDYRSFSAADIGLPGGYAPVHLLPGLAAYVGADITCGILASGLVFDERPRMLVDIGTNGEIVLKYNGKMYACATAAGPAFEGSGLSSGVRAADGAISHISVDAIRGVIEYEQIGEGKPTGLCGTAYLDFLSTGYMAGLISERGRFTAVANDYGKLFDDEYSKSFRIATGQGNRPIGISETDIATLMQAKGAIAAGIITLMNRVGIKPSDIEMVYLAGGFGMHINISSAIGCGLLPGFTASQIQVVGNTSLAGAYLALMDVTAIEDMLSIPNDVEIIELNLEPMFEDNYIDQLMMPA
jgi:uncharacterized 2Fe-2S/4Fe-4S cluster protein (DUF4445 family)